MTEIYSFIADPYFEKFIENCTPSTLIRRKTAMRAFLEYYEVVHGVSLMPADLLSRIQEDRAGDQLDSGAPENEWVGFVHWMRSDYQTHNNKEGRTNKKPSNKTIQTYAGSVKTFYKFFNCPLNPRARMPRQIARSKGRIENSKIAYRPDTVKRLVSAMSSNRDKAIALVMYQSGMDISSAVSLKYRHVREGMERNEVPLMIQLVRPKVSENYRTFVGPDAIDALRIYLAERVQDRWRCTKCGIRTTIKRGKCTECGSTAMEQFNITINDDSPLFAKSTKEEHLPPARFQWAMRKYALLSGLISKERLENSDMNPARPHSLRSGFKSTLKNAGMGEGWIDFFMGHTDRYGEAYDVHTDEEVRKQYEKFMGSLSLNRSEKFENRLTDLEAENTDLRRELSKLREEQQVAGNVLLMLKKTLENAGN